MIAKAVKSFPLGSSGGPSGLRPAHLAECLECDVGTALSSALAIFVEKIMSGSLPLEIVSKLGCARLVAILKDNGSYRPIAVGETLRRLAGKILLSKYGDEMSNHLAPLQVGVNVPGGLDSVVLEVEKWVHSDSSSQLPILQLDFRNAFNSIQRSWTLEQLKKCATPLQHYAHYFCCGPMTLYGMGYEILSRSGVQQGDPCGPLFFSVAIQPLLEKLSALGIGTRFYLDDGILRGTAAQLEQALIEISAFEAASGLSLNLKKCVLYHAPADLNDFPHLRGVPAVADSEGLVVLGVPIGSKSFTEAKLNKFLDDYSAALDKLGDLGNSQLAYHLLRVSLGACRGIFLLRLLPFTAGADLASRLSKTIQQSVDAIVGQSTSAEEWTLASFTLNEGGIGIADPVAIHPSAFVSCRLSAITKFLQLPAPKILEEIAVALSSFPLLPSVFSWIASGCRNEFESEWTTQKWWCSHNEKRRVEQWDQQVDWRKRAIRALNCAPHASDFLRVIPNQQGGAFIESECWQKRLAFRLSQRFRDAPSKCPRCHAAQDPFGDHALSCRNNGSYFRHNVAREVFRDLISSAGFSVKPGEAQVPHAPHKRADLLVNSFCDGKPLALDVSLIHPLQPSILHAEVDAKRLMAKRATLKAMTYQGDCAKEGWGFAALVGLTTGQWGSATSSLIHKLAKSLSMVEGKDSNWCQQQLWGKLSMHMARCCGQQLMHCFPRDAECPLDLAEHPILLVDS